ncbi:ribonuclease H-like domain-containing protein [Tanacetum coccineum]
MKYKSRIRTRNFSGIARYDEETACSKRCSKSASSSNHPIIINKENNPVLLLPKTAKQLTAKRNQERVKSILLLAIPDEYLLKFHNVPDAKSLWDAIKSSLDKAYDRFQKLISLLEVYAAPVSKEDINQIFLRSLPPLWSQIALIKRNKPDIDQTDIDDLYNNLRVYEDEMKRTNEVNTASRTFGVNTAGGTNSSSQIDQDDLEEFDIIWKVSMLTVRVQRFIKKTGRNLDFKGKQPVTFDKSQVECYNCHRKWHFAKECKSGWNQGKRSYGDNGRRNATTNEPSSQALIVTSENFQIFKITILPL